MPFLLIIHDEICHAMGKKPNKANGFFCSLFFPSHFHKKIHKKMCAEGTRNGRGDYE